MKIGLYSITYLGCWYRGEALTLPELIRTAKKFGYDGVEIDGKRPHGNPLDWPKNKCQELRQIADKEGIEILGVAANNDFSNPVPEVREAQICFMHELIRMTADLGAKICACFSPGGASRGIRNWPPTTLPKVIGRIVHEKFCRGRNLGLVPRGLIECARYAGEMGVTLALQNHKPLIKDHQDVLRMVREVNSPHLKICLDAPLMPDKSAAAMRRPHRRSAPCRSCRILAENSTAIRTAASPGWIESTVSSLARRTNTIAISREPCTRSATMATPATSCATNCPW